MATAKRPIEGGMPAPDLGVNTPSEMTPRYTPRPNNAPFTTNIINIEKATHRLLPSAVTGVLAQTGLDTSALDRAARLIAMNFDLSPAYLLGGVAAPKDPYTGQALSLATFRRLTQDVKPAVLEGMAPALFTPTGGDERVAERPWVASANANRLSRHIRAFGPVLAEYHPFAHEAVGLALELSKRSLNADKFANNLQTIIDWYKVDSGTLMRGRDLDWADLAAIAIEATQAKRNLRSAMDVRGFLLPEIGKLAEEGRKAQAAAQANADARGSWTMYAGGQDDWLKTNVDDLTPAATALIMGDYGNADLQAELTKRFGNGAEKRAARETLRRQAEVEQQRLKLQAMGGPGSIPDVDGLQDAYDILSDPNGDWFAASQMIASDIVDSQEGWSRSFVGRNLNEVIGAFEWYYKNLDKFVVWTAHSINMALLTDPTQEQREEAIYDWYRRQMAAGRSMGSLWAERLGIPTWIGSMAEFAFQVALDPWGVASKGLKVYRGTKIASGLADRTTLTGSLLAKTPGVDAARATLGLGTMAERAELLKEAAVKRYLGRARYFSENNASQLAKVFSSDDPVEVIRFIRKFGTNVTTGAPLDEPLLLKAQQEYIRRFGKGAVTQDGILETRDMLMSMFDMRPPGAGSLAESAWRDRRITTATARKAVDDIDVIQGRTYVSDDTGLLLPEATSKELGDALIDEFTGNPLNLEVPYYRYLANPLRRGRETLDDLFPGVRGKMRQTFGINPGPTLNINSEPGRWARLTANRSNAFTPREVDELVAKVQLAVRSSNPEAQIEKVVNESLIGEVIGRSVRSQKLPESLIPSIREDIEKKFGSFRKQAFALEDGKVFSAKPVLPTQRVNELVFPDVLQVQKYVEAVGNTYRDFLKSAPDELATILAGGGLRPQPGIMDRTTEVISKDVVRPLIGLWKTITVPRPGYAARVIILDEGLGRWTSTGYGIWERLGASQLEKVTEQLINVTGKGFATSLGIAAATTASLGNPALSAELAGIAATAAGLSLRPVRQVIARGVAKPIDALLDAYYPIEPFDIGGKVILLERPSRSILDDPFANTIARAREAMEQTMRDGTSMNRRYRFTEDWGRVTPKDPHYYDSWAHALNNTLGWAEPTRRALETVADGLSLPETKAVLSKWARGEGRATLRQMGWAKEETQRWVDLVANMTHSYTAGSKEIAAFALTREIDETALRKIAPAAMPDIVGPLVQEAAFGNANPLRRLVEFWYDTWVQSPENILNRQPYYKAAKRRAERAYLRLAEEANVANLDIDALKVSIDAASRKFALGQVKRIMFDFSENSRLGELMYAIYPFLQPYMEAFSVYGYILARRNPALPVYAKHLWDLGKETGFLREDKQTGEWVIPTSWVAGASIALSQFADMPGAQVLGPVQALSLWSNSSFRLPDNFPLIGGGSVPVPSMSPLATAVAQEIFGDTRSDALASYLFAYGPSVQVLPSAFQKFLQATFPEMFAEGMLNSIAMDYLIEYQYRGVYQDLASKPSSDPKWETALEEQAYKDAQQHMAMRAFGAFNGIGTSLYRWEWSPIRQEYFDLIEANGGNTQKAKEAFLTKYPGYGAMTVGKSVVGSKVTEWVDERGNIIPGSTGLRIPSTEYARRVLNSPAGEELLRRFGPLTATLFLQADPAAQENDFATYSQFLAKGLIETKTLTQFIMDVEQAGLAGDNALIVDEHEGFWGAITSFFEHKAGLEEGLKARGYNEDSQEFDNLDAQQQELFESLFAYFPASASAYLDQDASGKWQIAYGSSGKSEPDAITLAKFKAFAAMDQLEGFDVIKGLRFYLPQLDLIREQMVEAGVRSLRDPGAIELGLDVKYEELLTKLEEMSPPAAYAVKTMLPGVLFAAPNKGEDTVKEWKKSGDVLYQAFMDFEAREAELRKQLPETFTESERSAIYNQMSEVFNETYRATPEVIEAWWEKKSYSERKQYEDNLLTKYVGYMNLFELHLLGLDVSSETAIQIRTIAAQKSQAQRLRELLGSKFDREEVYGPIENLEQQFAANPGYLEVLNAQRTWGWALSKSKYVQATDNSGALWRNVLRLLHEAQAWATANKLTGTVYGSAANKDAYVARRSMLIEIVKSYKAEDEKFKNEWEYLNSRYGDGTLMNVLMPDYYFDYPLGPVSPRQAA